MPKMVVPDDKISETQGQTENTFVGPNSFRGSSLALGGYLLYLIRPSFPASAVIKPSGGLKSIRIPRLHPIPLNQDPRSRTQAPAFFKLPRWFPCAARLKATGTSPHRHDENFDHLCPGVLTWLRKVLSIMTSPCGLIDASLCCEVAHLLGEEQGSFEQNPSRLGTSVCPRS